MTITSLQLIETGDNNNIYKKKIWNQRKNGD